MKSLFLSCDFFGAVVPKVCSRNWGKVKIVFIIIQKFNWPFCCHSQCSFLRLQLGSDFITALKANGKATILLYFNIFVLKPDVKVQCQWVDPQRQFSRVQGGHRTKTFKNSMKEHTVKKG